jgi:SAM-dependent methyltransferase
MMGAARAWARRRAELLDDPAADDGAVLASLGDITRINRLLGGRRAAVDRLDGFFRAERRGAALTLLDVGAGFGDIATAAAQRAQERGLSLSVIALERHPAAAREAQRRGGMAVLVAEGFRLPFADGAADYVLCSQVLHHFDGPHAIGLVRELDRVARRAVVIADLRRSALAAVGIFLVSFPLRVHPTTRWDGMASVLRGYTDRELAMVCRAAGVEAGVRRHAGFRLTAAWRPRGAAA